MLNHWQRDCTASFTNLRRFGHRKLHTLGFGKSKGRCPEVVYRLQSRCHSNNLLAARGQAVPRRGPFPDVHATFFRSYWS
jgi:hypothetical protein